MPILCNAEGKKLSKRDFGFSLNDLIEAGYLHEAIDNYLAIIGGGTFEQEVMTLEELAHALNFEHLHSTGHIRYDVEKLRWLNHKWINRLSPEDLAARALPFLCKRYPTENKLSHQTLSLLIQTIKQEIYTLSDVPTILSFIFEAPLVDTAQFTPEHQKLAVLIREHLAALVNPETFVSTLKQEAKKHNIPLSQLFWFLRMALMGKEQGPAIHELIAMLGVQEARSRIEKVLTNLKT